MQINSFFITLFLCHWRLNKPVLRVSTLSVAVPKLQYTWIFQTMLFPLCIFTSTTNWLNVSGSGALNCLFWLDPGGPRCVLILHIIHCAFTDHCLQMEWASFCVLVICALRSSSLVLSKNLNRQAITRRKHREGSKKVWGSYLNTKGGMDNQR